MVSKAKRKVVLPGFESTFESSESPSSGNGKQTNSKAPSFTAATPRQRKTVSSSGGGNSNLKTKNNNSGSKTSGKKNAQKKKNNSNQNNNNSPSPKKEQKPADNSVQTKTDPQLGGSEKISVKQPSKQNISIQDSEVKTSSVSEMVIDEFPEEQSSEVNKRLEGLYTEELFKPDEEIEKTTRRTTTLRLSWTTGTIEVRTNDLVFIGTQNADLILPTEDRGHPTYVSRRHALIESVDGKAWLTDLGSRNGTFLNGERIRSGKQLLRVGDDIRFGLYHVEVEKS